VLDLSPGTSDDDVKCDIRIIDLDANEEYEALSYVWGDTRHRRYVWVSGTRTGVTVNLYDALLRLRHQNDKRTIWIDQLCINQWDMDEKAAQVALMRDIYRNCTHCILWLGEVRDGAFKYDEEHVESVFDFISSLGALPEPNLTALWKPDMHRSCICKEGTPTLFCDGHNGIMARNEFAAFAR
jgi:hypothetical protein